jgi:hypothetical protein
MAFNVLADRRDRAQSTEPERRPSHVQVEARFCVYRTRSVDALAVRGGPQPQVPARPGVQASGVQAGSGCFIKGSPQYTAGQQTLVGEWEAVYGDGGIPEQAIRTKIQSSRSPLPWELRYGADERVL